MSKDINANKASVKKEEAKKPEVKQPVKPPVKEQPAKQPAKVTPAPTNVIPDEVTFDNYKTVIANKKLTQAEKLNILLKRSSGAFKRIMALITEYCEALDPTLGEVDANMGASKQYGMYQMLKAIIDNNDYKKFAQEFDLVNYLFVAYKDGALGQYYVFRYELAWKWTSSSLTTLFSLFEMLQTLSDKGTRSANMSKINYDINLPLISETNEFSKKAVENINKYYNA